MADVAALNVVIGAKIDEFERAMKQVEQGVGRLGQGLQSAGGLLSSAITLPLGLLGVASLKAAGDIQALEKGFAATYKGSLPLQGALARVRELAKLPGLGLKEALQGATNLQAAGFSADLAARSLAAFGNALATVGKGKADLDGVGLALGQIASKGKISAEEINQLAERVPQIRGALKAAFGTADTEALNKAGISATQFVEGVTRELEKLPKVTGGLKNSFENLADAGTIALSKIGTALNNTFNVEGAIGAVSDALGGLAAGFETLDPAIQKGIFLFAGLAAAAGPVLLALGSIAAAAPFVAAGFAVITGPVGLAVAAIAGAAALIIFNFDRLKNYFTTGDGGRIFGGLATAAQRAFNALRPIVEAIADLIQGSLGVAFGIALTLAEAALNTLASTVTAALNLFSDLVQVFAGAFAGDWTQVWDGVKRIFLDAFLLLTASLREFTTNALRTLSGVAEKLGATGISKFLNETAEANINLESTLKRLLGITDPVAASLTKAATATAALAAAASQPVEVIDAAAAKRAEDMRKALEKLRSELQLNEKLSRALGDSYDFVGGRQSVLETGIKSLVSAGFDPAGRTVQGFVAQLLQVPDAIDKVDAGLNGVLGKTFNNFIADGVRAAQANAEKEFRPLQGIPVPPLVTSSFDASVKYFEGTALQIQDTIANLELPPLPPLPAFDSTAMEASIRGAELILIDVGASLSQGLANIVADSAAAFGAVLASTGSVGDALSGAFNAILQGMAAFAVQFGQLLIAQGTAVLLAKTLAANPVGAIAAGAALVALGSFAGALLKKGPNLSGGGGSNVPRGGGGVAPTATGTPRVNPAVSQAPATQNLTTEVKLQIDGRDLNNSLLIYQDRAGRVTGAGMRRG